MKLYFIVDLESNIESNAIRPLLRSDRKKIILNGKSVGNSGSDLWSPFQLKQLRKQLSDKQLSELFQLSEQDHLFQVIYTGLIES